MMTNISDGHQVPPGRTGTTHQAHGLPGLSVIDMPAPKTKYAPKKFTGHYADVEPFLEAYERLCRRFNVTLERDQCDTVRQYCSREVVGVIEGLTSFRDGKWSGLTGELIHLYDGGP